MNELVNEKLFCLLADTSHQATNEEMQNAYEAFIERVKTTVSQSEQTDSEIFRMLNITCIELLFIESLHQYEQGEKCA